MLYHLGNKINESKRIIDAAIGLKYCSKVQFDFLIDFLIVNIFYMWIIFYPQKFVAYNLKTTIFI